MSEILSLKGWDDVDFRLLGGRGVVKLRIKRPIFADVSRVQLIAAAVEEASAKFDRQGLLDKIEELRGLKPTDREDLIRKRAGMSEVEVELAKINSAEISAVNPNVARELFERYVSLREPVKVGDVEVSAGEDVFDLLGDPRLVSVVLTTLCAQVALRPEEGKGSASLSGSGAAQTTDSGSPVQSTERGAGTPTSTAPETRPRSSRSLRREKTRGARP